MLLGLGDGIVFLCAVVSLVYGIWEIFFKKAALYFKLIVGAMFCHILNYLHGICMYYTSEIVAEGFSVGYLGYIGCFLFLLTASFGYLDGILDDGTGEAKKSRLLALFAPAAALLLLFPNFFAAVKLETKIVYTLLWIPAMFSAYFNLKHVLIPDMGFGFVKAIRPFNIAALSFTLLQLVHLTLRNFCGWAPRLVSGILLGAMSILMMVIAQRGVKKWTL